MNSHTSALSVALVAALVAASPSVLAQAAPPDRGVEVEGSVMGGGFLSFPSAPVPVPGLGGAGWLGYRASPHLSVGVFGNGHAFAPAGDVSDEAGGVSRTAASGGVALRWRPLRVGRVAPWISAGVAVSVLSVRDVVGTGDAEVQRNLSLSSLATPVALGLDVAITRGLAVTVNASVIPWLPVRICDDAESGRGGGGRSWRVCDDLLAQGSDASIGVSWSASLGARYTFGR